MTTFTFERKNTGFDRNMFIMATAFLAEKAVPFAEASLRELVRYCLNTAFSPATFLSEKPISASEAALCFLEEGINRLAKGEPPQYITGKAPFFGYDLYVDNRVLIPRFDTEVLVEKALEFIKSGDRVLDLCSGSGCIGIAAALSVNIELVASDISEGAGEVFKKNVETLLSPLSHYSANPPRFVLGDLFDDKIIEKFPSDGFSFILSNPPYIAESEREELTADVLNEPHTALFGGADGLDFYRRIIPLAKFLLKDGGYLFLECGKGQSGIISNIMKENGYTTPTVVNDYGGIDRVVFASIRK